MPTHWYRLQIYEADDTTVDVTISGNGLNRIPDSFGAQRIDVLKGRSESLNWTIEVNEDLGTFPATYFSDFLGDTAGHATLLQRRVVMQRSDDAASWTTVAGGRILNIQQTNEMAYAVEIGDERWVERNTQTFTKGGYTTKVWPPGTIYGTWVESESQLIVAEITKTATRTFARFRPWFRVNSRIADLINSDQRPFVDPVGSTGAYRTLRFRFGGSTVRYEVDYLGEEQNGGLERGDWMKSFQIFGPTSQLPVGDASLRECYLWMPDHLPSETLPTHIGSNGVFSEPGIHPFRLLKNLYDGEYQRDIDPDFGTAVTVRSVRYNVTAMNALVENASIVPQRQYHRITEPMSVAEAAEKYVYRLTGYVPALDNTGAIKPIRVRLPTVEDVPSTTGLYELNASNVTAPPTWDHKTKDMVTAVQFNVQSVRPADGFEDADPWNDIITSADVPLDGSVATEESIVYRGDRLVAGVAINKEIVFDVHGIRDEANVYALTETIAKDVFARYADGPQYARVHTLASASTVEVGDIVKVNVATFPNTYNRQRGGSVLMQVTSRAVTPTGYTFELLHVGPDLQPLTAPSITLNRSTSDPKHEIDVTLAGGTTLDTYEVQFARDTTSYYQTVAVADHGQPLTVGELKSGTLWYGRARTQRANRIGSDWSVSDSTSTQSLTAPSNLTASSSNSGPNYALMEWTNGESDERVQVQNSTAGIVATLAAGSVQYAAVGLVKNYNYVYRVRHIDNYGGVSAYSTKVTFTTGSSTASYLQMSPPNYLEIVLGDDSLTSRVS